MVDSFARFLGFGALGNIAITKATESTSLFWAASLTAVAIMATILSVAYAAKWIRSGND